MPRWNVTSQLAPTTPTDWYSLVGGNKNHDPFGILTPIIGGTAAQSPHSSQRTTTVKGTAVVNPYQPKPRRTPKRPRRPTIPRGVIPIRNTQTVNPGGQANPTSGQQTGTGTTHNNTQNLGTTPTGTGTTGGSSTTGGTTALGGGTPTNGSSGSGTHYVGSQPGVIVNANPATPSELTPTPATLPDYLVNNAVLPAADHKAGSASGGATNPACVTPATETVMVPKTEQIQVPVQQTYTYPTTVDVPVTTTHWEWASYTATMEVTQRTWVSTTHWQSYWYWTPQKGWQESGWWVPGGYWVTQTVPETYTAWHWIPVTTTTEVAETEWVTGIRTVMQTETRTVMVPETETIYQACQTT